MVSSTHQTALALPSVVSALLSIDVHFHSNRVRTKWRGGRLEKENATPVWQKERNRIREECRGETKNIHMQRRQTWLALVRGDE